MGSKKKKYKAPKTRPLYINLKSRWKKPYFVSRAGNAQVVHRVCMREYYGPVLSVLRFYTDTGTYFPFVRSTCYPYSRSAFQLLSAEEAGELVSAGKFRWCRACDNATTRRR